MEYSYKKQVRGSFDQVLTHTRASLEEEGFGVLTEIDVKATLQKKLGIEYDRYMILGACNPSFAYQALQTEKEIGLLLPCNVLVYEDSGNVHVSAILPTVAMSMVENTALIPIAKTVEEKLKKVINQVDSLSERG